MEVPNLNWYILHILVERVSVFISTLVWLGRGGGEGDMCCFFM